MSVPTILGVMAGVSLTCLKNSLCTMPLYRKPWEHAFFGITGAYFFNWIVDKENEMVGMIEDYYAEIEAAKASKEQRQHQ